MTAVRTGQVAGLVADATVLGVRVVMVGSVRPLGVPVAAAHVPVLAIYPLRVYFQMR